MISVVTGCNSESGPALAKSTGVVKYKGLTVAGASVSFIYEDGQMATAMTDDAGKFNMTTGGREGAPPGKATVVVSKLTGGSPPAGSPPANAAPEDITKMYLQTVGEEGKMEPPKNELPEKYASPNSSTLQAEVMTDSTNDFLFELTD
jgi:hypothetical protein